MNKLEIGLRVKHKLSGVTGIIIMYNQSYNPLTRRSFYTALVRTENGDKIAPMSNLVKVRS